MQNVKVVGKVVLRGGKVVRHCGAVLPRRSLSGLALRVLTSRNLQRETALAFALRSAVSR